MRSGIFSLMAGALLVAAIGFGQQKPAKALPNGAIVRLPDSSKVQPRTTPPPFAIEGFVTDGNTKLKGVAVSVSSAHITFSDSSGHYMLSGLDRSVPFYLMRVDKGAYNFRPHPAKVTPPNQGDATVNFDGKLPSPDGK